MHPLSLARGTVLQERYSVSGAIDCGGMGAVYRAVDLRLEIPVAIKIAAADSTGERSLCLKREARLLASLRHLGLPRVLDQFSFNDRRCMVMELIDGVPLSSLISAQKGLPPDQVLPWIDQLLDILDYLHGQDPAIVHGDIKPQNLMLTSGGEIVLLDFGAAAQVHAATMATALNVTANYAAPEQLRGETPGPRSDLFSTAATMYHLLTGSQPADAQLRMQAQSQRFAEPLRPAHELHHHVSRELSAILSDALRLERDFRPKSAADLRRLLAAVPRVTVTEPPIASAPPPAARPAPSPPAAVEAPARPQYEVKKLLGEGGMGQVFLAFDTKNNQDVCLKRLRPNISVTMLRQECVAIARLNHPNIVKLFDYALDGPEPYMVTEFVDGISLASYLTRHRPLAPPVALEIGKQLLLALCHAHENSVTHCDLKPENILLVRRGAELIPKLLDFGLAIVEHRDDRGNVTGDGRIAGTPVYMAPEQFQGKILTPTADAYAIALIIAEMLTGQPIFSWDGANLWHIAQEKQALPFAVGDLRDVVAGLPSPVARALREATAQDPQARSTAAEFLQSLQEAVPSVVAPQIWAPLVDFIGPPGRGMPAGWFDSAGLVGGVSIDYDCRIEMLEPRPGEPPHPCVRIASTPRHAATDFASLMQRCPAWHLIGQRLSFTGWLMTENLSGFLGLWLRIDGQNGQTLFFDNMSNRAIRDTTPWTSCELAVEVPRQAHWLNYGILISGRGVARAARLMMRAGSPGQERVLTLFDSDSYK